MENLLSLLAAVGLLLFLFAYTVRPLVASKREDLTLAEHEENTRQEELADLLFRQETLLAALYDLQLDLEMGKISREDFERLNARYRAEAVRVLQRLDELQEPVSEQVPEEADAILDEWIETTVRRARLRQAAPVSPDPVREAEPTGTLHDSHSPH